MLCNFNSVAVVSTVMGNSLIPSCFTVRSRINPLYSYCAVHTPFFRMLERCTMKQLTGRCWINMKTGNFLQIIQLCQENIIKSQMNQPGKWKFVIRCCLSFSNGEKTLTVLFVILPIFKHGLGCRYRHRPVSVPHRQTFPTPARCRCPHRSRWNAPCFCACMPHVTV